VGRRYQDVICDFVVDDVSGDCYPLPLHKDYYRLAHLW